MKRLKVQLKFLKIIKFINNLGAGADVVSLGELKKCLKVGMKPNKIIFSGVGKDREEIAFAIQKKIKQLNIESEEELFDVIDIAEKEKQNIKIALRNANHFQRTCVNH